MQSEDFLTVNVTQDEGSAHGLTMLNAYVFNATIAEPDLTEQKPVAYTLETLSTVQGNSAIKNIKANYLYQPGRVVSYTASLGVRNLTQLALAWTITKAQSTQKNEVTFVVTIVAVVSVSVVCCVCCLTCIYKMLKASRRRQVYEERTEFNLMYTGRRPNRRIYSQYPASLPPPPLSDAQFDLFLPRIEFAMAVLEVGEAICSICLEE